MPGGFPLPLRDALAALVLDALGGDAGARAALAWLAAPGEPPPPAAAARLAAAHLVDAGGRALPPVHAPHAAAAARHAARALVALAAVVPPPAPDDPVAVAVARASARWSQALFFEVHEVLEDVWRTAAGERRLALQGLIQVAVAFHHLAHGNARGARTLLREGRARLEAGPDALPGVDTIALLTETAAWQVALDAGTTPPDGAAPPLRTSR
jgi:hypothetical protein